MQNKQLYNDTELIWMTNQLKNIHDRLNKTKGALHFKIL